MRPGARWEGFALALAVLAMTPAAVPAKQEGSGNANGQSAPPSGSPPAAVKPKAKPPASAAPKARAAPKAPAGSPPRSSAPRNPAPGPRAGAPGHDGAGNRGAVNRGTAAPAPRAAPFGRGRPQATSRARRRRSEAVRRRAARRRTARRRAALRRGSAPAGRSVPRPGLGGTPLTGALAAPPILPRRPTAAPGGRSPADGGGGTDEGGPAVASAIADIVDFVPAPVRWLLIALASLALLFGSSSLVTGLRARRLARERSELLGDVGLLQRALLPEVPERLGALAVGVAYRPAEGPGAGGDFYDGLDLGADRSAVLVGDVAGHGKVALEHTTLVRHTIRAYLRAGLDPRSALGLAGRSLEGDLFDGEIVTAVIAVFDSGSGRLTYSSAGHVPPIVTGPAKHEPVTTWSSPPIGGGASTGRRQTTISFAPGSAAWFFTDGLVEARVDGGQVGRDGLRELIGGLGEGEGVSELIDRLAARADSLEDDLAICVIEPLDGVAEPDVRVEELEIGEDEAGAGAAERFVRACGVPVGELPVIRREVDRVLSELGGAVIRVRIGESRPGVDVVPATVASLGGDEVSTVGIAPRG